MDFVTPRMLQVSIVPHPETHGFRDATIVGCREAVRGEKVCVVMFSPCPTLAHILVARVTLSTNLEHE